jgi:Domain of unknown function (DUF4406)
MPNWKASAGAREEYAVAVECGLEIMEGKIMEGKKL